MKIKPTFTKEDGFCCRLKDIWPGAKLLTPREITAAYIAARLIIKTPEPKHIYQLATDSFNSDELNTDSFSLIAKELLTDMLLTGKTNYLELAKANLLHCTPNTKEDRRRREHEIQIFNKQLTILKQLFRSPTVTKIQQ